jgi:hypothetical protein
MELAVTKSFFATEKGVKTDKGEMMLEKIYHMPSILIVQQHHHQE